MKFSATKAIVLSMCVVCLLYVPVVSQAQTIDTEQERQERISELKLQLAFLLKQLQALQSADTNARAEIVSDWSRSSINSSCVGLESEGRIYCVGGRESTKSSISDDVLLYDIATNRPGYFSDSFVTGLYANACASDSVAVVMYCFGGYTYPGHGSIEASDRVIKIDPTVDGWEKYETLDAQLPIATTGLACVEVPTEGKIYCFGGFLVGDDDELDELSVVTNLGEQSFAQYAFSFDLETYEVVVHDTDKDIAADDLSCTYSGVTERVYCFGGDTGSFAVRDVGDGQYEKEAINLERDTIFSFNPSTERFSVLTETLPTPRAVHACVAHPNGLIYCFGGVGALVSVSQGDLTDNTLNEILVFDPKQERLEASFDRLPEPIGGHSCVLDPVGRESIYCFGGQDLRVDSATSHVVRFTP